MSGKLKKVVMFMWLSKFLAPFNQCAGRGYVPLGRAFLKTPC